MPGIGTRNSFRYIQNYSSKALTDQKKNSFKIENKQTFSKYYVVNHAERRHMILSVGSVIVYPGA